MKNKYRDDEMLRPINQNLTDPNVPNPFVIAREERIKRLNDKKEKDY